MFEIIASFVAVCKTFNYLKELGELFVAEWIKYDITKIGDDAKAKQEEYEAINRAYKTSTSDSERRALLRTLSRLR
jgi:hypothetical protein